MSVTVLTCILLLGGSFMVFMLDVRMEQSLQLLLLGWVILFIGTIFTSTIFADLGDDKKAPGTLTLPATHFEKYLVAWLYSVPPIRAGIRDAGCGIRDVGSGMRIRDPMIQ